MECGSYRGIKLLEHAMKVVERIFEHRIRQQVEVDDMELGFMKGKGTSDAIFTARYYASAVLAVVMCLCVRLSVTSRYCIKTATDRIKQTTPHDSPGTLAF